MGIFLEIVFRPLPLSIRDGSLSLTSSSSDSLSSQLCGLCLRARRDLEVDMLPDAGFSFRSTTHFLSPPSLSYKRKKMAHSIKFTTLCKKKVTFGRNTNAYLGFFSILICCTRLVYSCIIYFDVCVIISQSLRFEFSSHKSQTHNGRVYLKYILNDIICTMNEFILNMCESFLCFYPLQILNHLPPPFKIELWSIHKVTICRTT